VDSPPLTPGSYRAPASAEDIERERLSHLSTLFDGPTVARLRRLGVGPGMQCLEVGAGSGSVARALGALVAPDGSVLATDVDMRFLQTEDDAHIETRVHDIVSDELPSESFDLVHARGVLEHIRARDVALTRVVDALRPGGLLVVEDTDWVVFEAQDLPPSFARLHRMLQDTYIDVAGYDPHLGRRLPTLFDRAGLVDIEAEGKVFTMYGGTPSMEWYVLGLERALPALVEAGVVEHDLATAALAEVRDPACRLLSPLQITAWARKP
jgi:SAM-dependent methyltransferase